MIDTVVITLSKGMFQITEPDSFQPSAKWILTENIKYTRGIQSKQNPTKKELISGFYKPRLTLSHRINSQGGNELMLKIELSLPKLMFGNNFQELLYKDFPAIIKKLVLILSQMGAETTTDILQSAPISAIHYSKNIALTDGSTPYHYINKIKEANIKLSLDVNQTDYRNDGHSYKWHSNSYEVVFYDKIQDLEQAKKSSKRALEKDNDVQLSFLKSFKNRRRYEILRMEVRLNKRQKMKQLFKNLGITADLTFKKLFKPAISKKILLHYLDEIESKRPALIDYRVASPKALLMDLIKNNPGLAPKQILQLFGLKQAFEVVNPRELRGMFAKSNQRSWYRLMADVNKVSLPGNQRSFNVIREQLMKFKPLELQK